MVMRGGTSKGVFVHEHSLPPLGADRDSALLALMGSPDPMQLDGLGGGTSTTSKVIAVRVSPERDVDIDYVVYQVGVDRAIVDASGNCGNLTAAVGPFAVDEGLVEVPDGTVELRLRNLNTDRRIVVRFPVTRGRFDPAGDHHLDGVPGTGAPIVTTYLDAAGAVTGRLLPTGRPADLISPRLGGQLEVSIVDVTSPVVIVRAEDLGIAPSLDPSAINADGDLLQRLESIRAASAVAAGLAVDEADALARSAAVPRVAIIAGPHDHELESGLWIGRDEHDLVVRATSLQRAHHAVPLTTAMCVVAATTIEGTVCHEGRASRRGVVRLAHAKGIMEVGTWAHPGGAGGAEVLDVSVVRTARRLLGGVAHLDL